MKTKFLGSLIVLALFAGVHQIAAQGTAFTYQGQLRSNGNLADNNYDLTFALFNSSSGAGQVGSTITYTDIGVSNGLFTVVLDFGANFPGADRWLEIGVRTNGGSGLTILTPRQKLTPAPYAITAGSLNGVLPVAQLPGTVLTNHESGVSLTNLMLTGALNLADTATAPDLIYSGSALLLYNDNNGNFFSGQNAGNLTMSGTDNTGIGDLALQNNLIGFDNTAVGYQALYQTTNSYYNTAIGYETLFNNSSGSGNTAVGWWALYSNTSGSANTAIGIDALIYNSSGYDNTAIGEGALQSNTNGYHNTANGGEALSSNTSGVDNAANGYKALYNNVTGFDNAANGAFSLFDNTSGYDNTADGSQALVSNANGTGNTAVGYGALDANNSGSDNIALGYDAGAYITTGDYNIDIGNYGELNDSGVIRLGQFQTTTYIAGNVGLGGASPQQTLSLIGGMNIDQSGQNAGLFNNGAGSGYGLSFGSGSGEGIASQRTGGPAALLNGLSFYTSFGNRMTILNTGLIGINTTSPTEQLSVNGGANKPGGGSWDTFSDGRLKDIGTKFTHGLEAMASIQPVHYHYKTDNSLQLPSQPEYVGVVAQQVQSAVPEAVHRDPDGYLVVNNDPIIWTMFNAIKELNQKTGSETKEKDVEIQALKQQNDSLTQRFNELERTVKQLAANK